MITTVTYKDHNIFAPSHLKRKSKLMLKNSTENSSQQHICVLYF